MPYRLGPSNLLLADLQIRKHHNYRVGTSGHHFNSHVVPEGLGRMTSPDVMIHPGALQLRYRFGMTGKRLFRLVGAT